MKKYLYFTLLILFVGINMHNIAYAENTRQIKSSEDIKAENAHLNDALSPLTNTKEVLEIVEEKAKEDDKEQTDISQTEIVYTTRTTPIMIEHRGEDDLGVRLAMRMKNEFNQSSLFNLEESRDMPKLLLSISTVSEFKERPAMGSVYGLVWIFVHDSNTLRYYLDQEIGVFTAEEIDGLIAKIMDRADGFAVLYSYLFAN